MAGEGAGILIRLLLALEGHDRGRDPDGLPRIHVAGLATVHDIGFRYVDLHNPGVPIRGSLFQTVNLGGREVHHVV